jgi:hypothetical protein
MNIFVLVRIKIFIVPNQIIYGKELKNSFLVFQDFSLLPVIRNKILRIIPVMPGNKLEIYHGSEIFFRLS